ncbi:hypothetical protein AB1Y20_013282 [Prymnesium parvum]|uniref:Uncharacterized protein n=1 Tax=Prymnesium parvum TaxID=97485 RepID=A0AB34IL92_PRYPA
MSNVATPTHAERTSPTSADEGEPSRAPSWSRTPRRSPRRSDDAAKQAAKQELKKLHDDMETLGNLTWCGQAEKLDRRASMKHEEAQRVCTECLHEAVLHAVSKDGQPQCTSVLEGTCCGKPFVE